MILLISALLAACTGIASPTAPAEKSSTASPSLQFTVSPAPITRQTEDPPETATSAPTPPTAQQVRPHYTLTAELDYDQHYLIVDEQIEYTNLSPDYLPDLRLMVDPLYYPGAFVLKSISIGDGQPLDDYQIETGQIRVPLPAPLSPGERIHLALSYELSLPSPAPSAEIRPIPFGYTARQTNLVDWYPFIPPYVAGKGWLAHPAGFFGEHQVSEMADFDVSVRIRDDRPALIVAASAPSEPDGEWRRYQHTAARSFAWSVSPEYEVFETMVGDTQVLSYAFPFHASAGEAVLNTTAQALALYGELYGAYPRPLLSVVEADFLDGMEYDGLYFLSNGFYNLYQGQPGEYLIAIAAHETAHQWYYAAVGNDQAIEPWLDEALCTYQERVYYERIHPEALDWWWAYRVNYYDPRGWVDGSIYNPEGYRSYRDAIYLNGAVFLEELRGQIGDTAFFSFLNDYISQNTGQITTADRFFEILSQHTNADLEPLISQYFKDR